MELPFPLIEPASQSAIDKGRKLFRTDVNFLKGVVAPSGLPAPDRIEFCFAGRSNVGKSSLINALTGQKNLARASSTPGRTQEINFFTLSDGHYMVDLPGYGYAKAPLKTVEKWQRLLKTYLSGRANLRRVFLLIDARHGAKAVDEEIMMLLDQAAVTFQIVFTKTDKISAKGLELSLANTRKILQNHPAAFPEMVITSSEKNQGVDDLRALIAGLE